MKNETSVECCPKCGNREFAVARDMKSTRHCWCGATWLPGEQTSHTPPTGELQGKDWRDTTLKILEKQNKHLMQLVANMDLQRPIFIEVPKPQPPASDAEELAETCYRLDLAHENEKLRKVLEKIALPDSSPSFHYFLGLLQWRNDTKNAARWALKGKK
jgi:hypothetical protein